MCQMSPMSIPQSIDAEWVLRLTQRLDAATRSGSLTALRDVLPADALCHLWEAASSLLAAEPTLLEVNSWNPDFCMHRTCLCISLSPFRGAARIR